MDAVILAAGRGRRMAPLTTVRPKPMLPLAGRPILEHVLERCGAAGVGRAVVVVEALADVVRQELVAPAGMEVVFVRQGDPRGTGHAVATAAPHAQGDSLLLMGDSLVATSTLQALVDADGLCVAAAPVADGRSYGVLETEGDRIVGLVEKPPAPAPGLANTGAYHVPEEAFGDAARAGPSPRGEVEFTDVVRRWAEAGRAGWIEAQAWRDIGNPWQYLDAHEALLPELLDDVPDGAHRGPGEVEEGVHVRGRLWVEEDAVVRSGAYVEGAVLVRRGARVGPNCHLRGPVEVGPGCHVGAATEVKNSILLEGARAPHHNYVGDSVLGHGCNLGSGTKLANLKVTPGNVHVDWDGARIDTGRRKFGAVVGDHAGTGINCSLNPGTVLGAGSAVGPGIVAPRWLAPGALHLA